MFLILGDNFGNEGIIFNLRIEFSVEYYMRIQVPHVKLPKLHFLPQFRESFLGLDENFRGVRILLELRSDTASENTCEYYFLISIRIYGTFLTLDGNLGMYNFFGPEIWIQRQKIIANTSILHQIHKIQILY